MVVKRTGDITSFDPVKIRNAIGKAKNASKEEIDEDLFEGILNDIYAEVHERFIDFHPNVENVQDIVEKHLVKNGLYEISKAYILYRAKRQEKREERKEELIERAKLGKLTVKKREGRTVLFDINKLRNNVIRMSKGFEDDIDSELVVGEVIKNIYDGLTTKDIERALILAGSSFIEKDPAYSYLAARFFLQKLHKEVTEKSINSDSTEVSYRESFIKGINKGIENDIFDIRLKSFDLVRLSEYLKLERDSLFAYTGMQTLYERYFAKVGETRIEMPQSFWMRVAMGLSLKEEAKYEKTIEFYELLSSLRFVSSTPTLFHSGLKRSQLSSCYLTTVSDDLKHIFKCFKDNALLSKYSGGLGNDWTNIRSTGALINSIKVESQGVIPFLKIANEVTNAINRSGKRRGATCAYLETWHLDIEDFLDLRKNTGDERRRTHDMNTANWIPDLFMKRILEDKEWTLFSPDEVPELHHLYGKKFEEKYGEYEEKARNGKIKHKVLKAKNLWKKMLTMLFETGHPWITFKDACNIRSPQDHVGVIHSSNLCTEITLNTSEEEVSVCNLGSINLEKHVKEGKMDEELLCQTIKTGIRMLDNVIDLNYYPIEEAKFSNLKHRPIGMGIMGFQDALFRLNYNFESEETLEFTDKIMELISLNAILASSELAKERGTYETYKGSKWERGIFPVDTLDLLEEERGMKIETDRKSSLDWSEVKEHVKEHGMRNSNVIAIAPTATIANISGCFPCIEPIYKNIYVKANISGEFTIVNNYLIEDLKKLDLWNEETLDQLKYHDGNLNLIASVPDSLKKKHKEAFDIDPEFMLKLTAIRGKWIDQSQSHNVFMRGVSGNKLSEIYFTAWRLGLKTTYYLRTLAASQIEKSTLSTEYGFTQKRNLLEKAQVEKPQLGIVDRSTNASPKKEEPALCKIEDPECESCQ